MGRVILSFLPRLYSTSASSPPHPLAPLPHPLPALTSTAANPHPIPPANLPFGIVAALSWAGVMYIFRHRGERLQPGMSSSMSEYGYGNADVEYLYHDSEAWNDLRTLLWHNT